MAESDDTRGAPELARRPVLCRPAGPASRVMAAELAEAGHPVIEAPAIELVDRFDQVRESLAQALEGLCASGGWLILPSPGAVEFLGRALKQLDLSPQTLEGIATATVGRGSARAIRDLGLPEPFIPPEPLGASLAATLPAQPGQLIVLVSSSQSRPELAEGLAARELAPVPIALYEPRPCEPGLAALARVLDHRDEQPILIVTSPSGVDAILDRMRPADSVAWVAIGPTTRDRLHERGIAGERVWMTTAPTGAAILEAIYQVERADRTG